VVLKAPRKVAFRRLGHHVRGCWCEAKWRSPRDQLESWKGERFDMWVIDADKLKNWTSLDLAVKMSYYSASIFVDKYGLSKLTAKRARNKPPVQGAGKDERVDVVFMQTVS
jgi:hypothetical protein